MILDYLSEQATCFTYHAENARDGICAGVKLLSDSGAVTDEYVNDVLAGYEKYGPYFVLTPNFALPHAQPTDKCKRPALSFLKLSEPICFGHEMNDPVHYVMALAGTDHDSHRQLLKDLMGFLSNEQILEKLPTVMDYAQLRKLIEENT